jgi:glycosyltransferase involved in cell wall biosynthesis
MYPYVRPFKNRQTNSERFNNRKRPFSSLKTVDNYAIGVGGTPKEKDIFKVISVQTNLKYLFGDEYDPVDHSVLPPVPWWDNRPASPASSTSTGTTDYTAYTNKSIKPGTDGYSLESACGHRTNFEVDVLSTDQLHDEAYHLNNSALNSVLEFRQITAQKNRRIIEVDDYGIDKWSPSYTPCKKGREHYCNGYTVKVIVNTQVLHTVGRVAFSTAEYVGRASGHLWRNPSREHPTGLYENWHLIPKHITYPIVEVVHAWYFSYKELNSRILRCKCERFETFPYHRAYNFAGNWYSQYEPKRDRHEFHYNTGSTLYAINNLDSELLRCGNNVQFYPIPKYVPSGCWEEVYKALRCPVPQPEIIPCFSLFIKNHPAAVSADRRSVFDTKEEDKCKNPEIRSNRLNWFYKGLLEEWRYEKEYYTPNQACFHALLRSCSVDADINREYHLLDAPFEYNKG